MSVIRSSIRNPVSTSVGVILLVMFGVIALFRLPVQLTPDVEDPVITVTTIWPGASPAEVEREIVQEQEDQLKTLEGLVEDGKRKQRRQPARIRLEVHRTGTDIDSGAPATPRTCSSRSPSTRPTPRSRSSGRPT